MKVVFLSKKVCFFVFALIFGAVLSLVCLLPSKFANVVNADEAIYKGTNKNCVGLMFNVYGGDEFLDDILDTLKSKNVRATFFIGGVWATKNLDSLKKIIESGNEIANHGFLHKDHKKLSLQANKEEILKTQNFIFNRFGVKTTLFAPPSGSFGKNTLRACQELGYKTIMWTNDTIDWRDQDENLIISRATKSLKGGELILMHPTKATSASLSKIIEKIESTGLKIDIVSNII